MTPSRTRDARFPFSTAKVLAAALTACCMFGVTSGRAADDGLSIEAPYVRLAPPHAAATGAFMTIRNAGPTERLLVAAESPAAKRVELHNHINEDGMMKMRQVKDIAVPAHGQVELKPGSMHVMLIGINAPLKEGDNVSLTLRFDDGSRQQVEAPVKAMQMTMPQHTGHGAATGEK